MTIFYRLHGFGVKLSGLRRYGRHLTSADSLAWSYAGRRVNPCPHTGAMSCANCLPYAEAWRRHVTDTVTAGAAQMTLDL